MAETILDERRGGNDMEVERPKDEAPDSASKGQDTIESDTEGADCEDEAMMALVASVFPIRNGQSLPPPAPAFRHIDGKSSRGL